MTRNVDVAIIGAGTAGMGAYRNAVKQTNSVLLIEGDSYGTTCASVGCMPSKMLIAAANAAHAGQHAEGFGIHFDAPRIDGPAVMKRLKSLRDHYVNSVKDSVQDWPADHRVMARAKFTGPDTLHLTPTDGSDPYTVTAKRIVIATGASAIVPGALDTGAHTITSDAVFDWTDLPKSVLVFGAGVIGLELGQALHRLGVRTVLLGKDNDIAQLSDPDVRKTALSLISDVMPFHPDHTLDSLTETSQGVRAVWSSAQGGGDEVFEKVLVAVGRAPDVSGLQLDTTGLALLENGVPKFDKTTGQCGDSTIYIAGDANAYQPLLHTAAREGKTAGKNAATHPDLHQSPDLAGLSVTFCEPQIATAGQSYQSLENDGVPFCTGEIDWRDQGRATVMRVNHGMTRLYGDQKTGRLLGAEMIGPDAEHLAHLLAWAITAGDTVTDLLERPFYHPCVEEGLRTALRNLAYAMETITEKPVPKSLDCGPGC